MKLKRLLLRYNPAGVGLECTKDDGEIQVIHKDLQRAQGEECSMAEVRVLADELINGEPDLLSRKKHLSAIIQLLCRLYKVEDAEEAGKSESLSPKKKKEEKGDSVARGVCNVGDKVILAGLKPPHNGHNGYVGTVVKVHEKGKVDVIPEDAESSDPIKVKGDLLMRIQNRSAGAVPGDIAIGAQVSITRLRNHGALNGTIGRVVEYNQATSRYEIRATETGQLFRVKPDNVVPLMDQGLRGSVESLSSMPEKSDGKITVGCIVALCGLKNAASLNGEEAEVLGIDEEKARMDIRMKHDGSVKKVKSDNVCFVSGPVAPKNPAVEFEPGQIVTLCGLRSAASLNGARAEIRRRDPGTDRYEIRLESDGSIKKVRGENLQLV